MTHPFDGSWDDALMTHEERFGDMEDYCDEPVVTSKKTVPAKREPRRPEMVCTDLIAPQFYIL